MLFSLAFIVGVLVYGVDMAVIGNSEMGEKLFNERNRRQVSGTYTPYNCGSSGGISTSGSIVHMEAFGPNWPANHFCQIKWKDATSYNNDYTFSLSFKCTQTDPCHPGLMFNWQDSNNFDFVYLRTHNSNNCFVYGRVVSGVVTANNANIQCGSPIANGRWSQIKVVLKSGLAQAYVDGAITGSAWAYHFTGGSVGAAAANGYSDKIDYSNFGLVKDYYNCGSGEVLKFSGLYQMEAFGPKWNDDHFCQLLWQDARPYAPSYSFSLSFLCEQYNECHPGLFFNWRDENNYDFFYVRTHLSHNCFVYGWVINGIVTTFNPNIQCSRAVLNRQWTQLKVVIRGTKAQAYVNEAATGSEWTYHFTTGFVGGATANGYTDVVDYKEFTLVEDYYNCGSGSVAVSNDVYHMKAAGAIWPTDHFCQIPWKDTRYVAPDFEFSLYFNCTQTDPCHPGLMLNWQDPENYDFVYLRTHSPNSCFVYGWVVNGIVTTFSNPSVCGSPITNMDWFQLKVAVKDNKARAYVNGAATGNEWTPKFTAGYVGAAAANGYNDEIDYKDFQLVKGDYNCGTGKITEYHGFYQMEAYGPKWSEDHFCQIVTNDATFYNNKYTFLSSMYCSQSNECHPGLMFNWQDENNYDFFYVRTHLPTNCFVYGWVINGVVTAHNPAITCGSTVANFQWTQLKVVLKGTQARAYVDGVATGSAWNYHFPGGYVGGASANGYKDLVDYRNFALTKDYYNCGTGGVVETSGNILQMTATGLQWSKDHFCQSVYSDTYRFPGNYAFSLSLYCTQTDVCHPGLMFNWQDSENYNFIYVRTHNPVRCFVYGSVVNGIVTTHEGGACGSAVSNQNWIKLKVVLKDGKKVQAYVDNAVTGNEWTYKFSGGFVGGATANGYNDVVNYKDFTLTQA